MHKILGVMHYCFIKGLHNIALLLYSKTMCKFGWQKGLQYLDMYMLICSTFTPQIK